MGEVLVGIGLVSLVLGAWSGFALLVAVDKPTLLRSIGVVDPHRVRQLHLDWIIMGAVAIATGLALPNLNPPLGILIATGVVVNPVTFIPMAFSRKAAQQRWFQAVSMASFIALTVGLTGATAVYILD